jgi:hypothetical protein
MLRPGKGPELVAHEVDWHRDRDGSCLRGDLRRVHYIHKQRQYSKIHIKSQYADREETSRLKTSVATSRRFPKCPHAIPEEVVGDRDAEREYRRSEMVNIGEDCQQCKCGQVEDVPPSPHNTELKQLRPIRRSSGAEVDATQDRPRLVRSDYAHARKVAGS